MALHSTIRALSDKALSDLELEASARIRSGLGGESDRVLLSLLVAEAGRRKEPSVLEVACFACGIDPAAGSTGEGAVK